MNSSGSTLSRGFTLIEVVVALGVTAVLAAAIAPLVIRAVNAPKEDETQREMRAFSAAITGDPDRGIFGFLGTYGRLPILDGGQLAELTQQGPLVNGDAGTNGVPVGWVGPYLNVPTQAPLQDAWFSNYTLDMQLDGGVQTGWWRVRSPGFDRTTGTADDIYVPQNYMLQTGTLRIELLRDIGAAAPANYDSANVTSVTLYYPVNGVETAAAGSLVSGTTNEWAFLSGGLPIQIPLGTHPVKVITVSNGTFYRNVTIASMVNVAKMTIAYSLSPSPSGTAFCCGSTTAWSNSGSGVTVTVDTSSCGYGAVPNIQTSLSANATNCKNGAEQPAELTTGASTVLSPTATGFSVIVTPTTGSDTTATAITTCAWKLSWCGTP